MQQRKKVYGLTALWLFMAAVVVIVWLLHEHKKVASVYILPVDGELMTQNWEEFQSMVDSLQPFGILLEPDTLGQKPEFGRLIGNELSVKIKQSYPNLYKSITPDSLYQKAFATTIRKAVDKLDERAYQNLIATENKTAQTRTIALLENETDRDSIIKVLHTARVKLLGPNFDRIPKRYAGLLMVSINRLLLQYPDQRWLILVDVEKYSWLKTKLIEDQRIAVLNEEDF